jgi:hypothetical protein
MHKFIRQLKNKYHWSNKLKISSSSVFVCNGDVRKTVVRVHGENNVLTLGYNTRIINTTIAIDGDNNQVTLGDTCYVRSGEISDRSLIM